MPNGVHLNVDRRQFGTWHCYLCGGARRHDEFYGDRTRWNGCSSRCMDCENERTKIRSVNRKGVSKGRKIERCPRCRSALDPLWLGECHGCITPKSKLRLCCTGAGNCRKCR